MSVELPKLPNKAKLYTAMPDDYRYGHVYGYTADHMREYGRAVERAAYERAAQECEKRAGPIEIYNRAYSNFMDCAAAIRALMAKEQPK